MSLNYTVVRSVCTLSRAQNRAITIESAPKSSKNLLSTDTRSTCMASASTSAKTLSVLDSGRAPLTCLVGDSGRPIVNASRASCTMSGGLRSSRQLTGADHVLAEYVVPVQGLYPVGVVDSVEIALAEVWGDGHRDQVLGAMQAQPVHCTTDHGARGAAEQESGACQSMAGTDGV